MQGSPSRSDATDPTRRRFLAGAAAAAGFAATAGRVASDPPAPSAPAAPARKPALALRPFGKTPEQVTLLGLGCFPLGSLPDADDGAALVRKALEAGINYFDTAPSYGGGKSESRIGVALKSWPREKVFLATKTHTRTPEDARRDLEGSLERLRVSRIDLVQVHAISDAADLDRALAKDGPLAALVKAREEGLVRYIGVTGHADPAVMRQTFARWPFDSILFPLNAVDPHHLPFVQGTLPAAMEAGLARIAMKVFASGNLPKRGVDPERCLRYTLGLDITTAIVGCGTPGELDLALRVASDPRPLEPGEAEDLLKATKPHAGRGVEWYKRV